MQPSCPRRCSSDVVSRISALMARANAAISAWPTMGDIFSFSLKYSAKCRANARAARKTPEKTARLRCASRQTGRSAKSPTQRSSASSASRRKLRRVKASASAVSMVRITESAECRRRPSRCFRRPACSDARFLQRARRRFRHRQGFPESCRQSARWRYNAGLPGRLPVNRP